MERVLVRASWRDYLELTKPRVVALMLLMSQVNALTAWLALASLIGYAFVYTLFPIRVLGNRV